MVGEAMVDEMVRGEQVHAWTAEVAGWKAAQLGNGNGMQWGSGRGA